MNSSSPGAAAQRGKIFDANRLTLTLLLRALPVHIQDFGIVPDDSRSIQAVLQRADEDCDVVLTSGGVSVGDADWVKQVVNQIGAVRLWKLNLKPGETAGLRSPAPRPVLRATRKSCIDHRDSHHGGSTGTEKLCGGSPAEPLAVPALLRGELRHEPGREEFQRGTLFRDQGELHVRVTGDQSSNVWAVSRAPTASSAYRSNAVISLKAVQ
jgi:molybdopterin molybdotransferase